MVLLLVCKYQILSGHTRYQLQGTVIVGQNISISQIWVYLTRLIGMICSQNNFQLQTKTFSMSRDQTVIKNKLLDAMIPDISFKDQALPLQPRPSSKILQRPRSSMLTRQSYINLQEKLQETPFSTSNNGNNFISTVGSLMSTSNVKICENHNAETQRRSNRKYIRVVSNPHELLFPNSPRQSTTNNHSMRRSAIFQERKSANAQRSLQPASSSQLRKGQIHHESHTLIHQPSRSIQFPVNFSQACSQNPSIKLGSSKINSLEKLIAHDDIQKRPQSISKTTYLQLNDASNTLNIRQNKPQPQIIYPTADFKSNILRVAIGKVQPVFRTIVRKDISNSGTVQRAQSQSELKNGPPRSSTHGMIIPKGPIHQSYPYSSIQRVNHMMGREDQMLKLDTNALRTQIVRQVLR